MAWLVLAGLVFTGWFGFTPCFPYILTIAVMLFARGAGSLLTLQTPIDMADAVLFILAVINIIGLYLLAPEVKRELNSFLAFVRRRDADLGTEADTDQEPVKTTV